MCTLKKTSGVTGENNQTIWQEAAAYRFAPAEKLLLLPACCALPSLLLSSTMRADACALPPFLPPRCHPPHCSRATLPFSLPGAFPLLRRLPLSACPLLLSLLLCCSAFARCGARYCLPRHLRACRAFSAEFTALPADEKEAKRHGGRKAALLRRRAKRRRWRAACAGGR